MAIAIVFYQHDGIPSYIHEGSFIRWCWSTYMEAWFPFLFNNRAFVHVYNPCPQIALYEWSLDQCLNQVTFVAESFLSKIWMRNFSATSRNCSFDGVVVIFVPQSYLDVSRTKPWLCIAWSESFWRGFFSPHVFLLNPLKVDDMNHMLRELVL
jgi:hypothetical protein